MKMTKLFAMAVAVPMAVLGATAIFAQQPGGQHNSVGTQVHQMYVDENGDGLNDNIRPMQEGTHNGGKMHGQNHSGAGHQNGGQGMHSGNQGMHGMMDGQNHSRMGHQGGMGYHGSMGSASGTGGGYGSHGSMGRH